MDVSEIRLLIEVLQSQFTDVRNAFILWLFFKYGLPLFIVLVLILVAVFVVIVLVRHSSKSDEDRMLANSVCEMLGVNYLSGNAVTRLRLVQEKINKLKAESKEGEGR